MDCHPVKHPWVRIEEGKVLIAGVVFRTIFRRYLLFVMFFSPVVYLAFANPEKKKHLRFLREESRDIAEALRPLSEQGAILLENRQSATIQELQTILTKHYKDRIEIFHYGGHANGAQLMLEDGGGRANGLAGLLALQKNLKLVFLNGCSTQEQVHAYMDAGVPAIIYTSEAIYDDESANFATLFYQALINDHDIEQAFEAAQSSLLLNKPLNPTVAKLYEWKASIRGQSGDDDGDFPWQLYLRQDQDEIRHWKITDRDIAQKLRIGAKSVLKEIIEERLTEVTLNAVLEPEQPQNKEHTSIISYIKQEWSDGVRRTDFYCETRVGKVASLVRLWQDLSTDPDGSVPLLIEASQLQNKSVFQYLDERYLRPDILVLEADPDITEGIVELLNSARKAGDQNAPSLVFLIITSLDQSMHTDLILTDEILKVNRNAPGLQIVAFKDYHEAVMAIPGHNLLVYPKSSHIPAKVDNRDPRQSGYIELLLTLYPNGGNEHGWHHVLHSPDGRIVAATSNNHLYLMRMDGTQLRSPWEAQPDFITHLEFSRCHEMVLTCGERSNPRLWDYSGNLLAECRIPWKIEHLQFSPDQNMLIGVTGIGTAHLWSLDGEEIVNLGQITGSENIAFIAVSTDHKSILMTPWAGQGGVPTLYDLDGTELAEFPHSNAHQAVFSPHGEGVCTLGTTIKFWDRNGHFQGEFEASGRADNYSRLYSTFLPDGSSVIYSEFHGRSSQLWLAGGETSPYLRNVSYDALTSLAVSSKSNVFLTGDAGGGVQFWVTANIIEDINWLCGRRYQCHPKNIRSLSISPDDTSFWTTSTDGRIRGWSMPDHSLF